MYAEVGGIWGAGVVVWVVDEAFCRTYGGLYVKAFVTVLPNTFGVLDFAGKIEKTGMMVDLSIFFFYLAIIALKTKNSGTKSIRGEDSATENCQKLRNDVVYARSVLCACFIGLTALWPVSIP
jgi:asparagine N-glycosylation enzyme membrane subunit Stt3